MVPTGQSEACLEGSLSGHSGLCTLSRGSSGYGHLSCLPTGERAHTHPQKHFLASTFFLHWEGGVAAS